MVYQEQEKQITPPPTMHKTALVTGSNQGIGFEIARLLLSKSDFHIILGCRSEAKATEAAAKLVAETGVDAKRIRTLPVDLQNHNMNRASAAQLAADPAMADGLDVLINNAGFAFKTDATEPFAEQARITNDVNYYGTKNVFECFAPLLEKNSKLRGVPARVINVSSRAGLLSKIKSGSVSGALQSADLTVPALDQIVETFNATAGKQEQDANPICTSGYGFSKVVLSALTRIYASQYERRLHIVATCPGWCRTSMAGQEATNSAADGADVEFYLATCPFEELVVKAPNGCFVAERKRISYVHGDEMKEGDIL